MLKGVYKLLIAAWGVESLHLLSQDWSLQFCLPGWGLTWGGLTAWLATTLVLLGGAGLTLLVKDRRVKWLSTALAGGATVPVLALLGGLLQISTRPDWLCSRPWIKIKVLWPDHTHVSEFWGSFYETLGGQTNPAGVVPQLAYIGDTLAQTRASAIEAALHYLAAVPAAPAVVSSGITLPNWVWPVGAFLLSVGFNWWLLNRVQIQFNEELTRTTRKVNQIQTLLDVGQTATNNSFHDGLNDLRARIKSVASLNRSQLQEAASQNRSQLQELNSQILVNRDLIHQTNKLALVVQADHAVTEAVIKKVIRTITRNPWGELSRNHDEGLVRTPLEKEVERLAKLVLHLMGKP